MSRKKVTKKKVTKRKVKKSKLAIVIFLLAISIFSISYATKNIVASISSIAISKSKEKEVEPLKEEKDKIEIEQLSLDNENAQKKYKVVIDAGHGGIDSGRTGFSKKSLEKDITLQLTKKIASKLTQYKDIEVILTRSEDITLSVEERANIANSQKADLLVSIHLNGEYGGNLLYSTIYGSYKNPSSPFL
ncbi:MAG: N-acetylmuramoyl-L-alanine amidase [Romboutsia sp.]|nr:N-acetylmuramoyl-L-alanine amidase [Romboutsia sp.]